MILKEVYPIDKFIKLVNDIKECTGFDLYTLAKSHYYTIHDGVYINDDKYLCIFNLKETYVMYISINDFRWSEKEELLLIIETSFRLYNKPDVEKMHYEKGYLLDKISPETIINDLINEEYYMNHGEVTDNFVNLIKRCVKIKKIKKLL